MIGFIGDVHRAFDSLARAVAELPANVEMAIQVGDLGLHFDDLGPSGPGVPFLSRRVYYVTGNHDHEPLYKTITRPTEVAHNLVFVPRGAVLELDGRRIAFLGGGDSIADRALRRDGVDWWPEERISMADISRFEGVGRVDLLVCHTPPAFVYPIFHLRPDPSSVAVERAWKTLGRPPVICGHLHKGRAVGCVRVLGELEILVA
jgi:Calcineurin-like phosphoesterase